MPAALTSNDLQLRHRTAGKSDQVLLRPAEESRTRDPSSVGTTYELVLYLFVLQPHHTTIQGQSSITRTSPRPMLTFSRVDTGTPASKSAERGESVSLER